MGDRKFKGVDKAVVDKPRETFFGKTANGWDGEEENRKAKEAVDRYNNEGLANLEASLGLIASGQEHERINAIAAEVERRVLKWQKMSPSALLKDHGAIQALFVVTEKVSMTSYLHHGRLPDCWWARLAICLDERGLYDALVKQIHRETHARAAREFLRDERGMGGKARHAGTPASAAKAYARDLWPEANRKGWTAAQFHAAITGKGHAVPFDTARKWLTSLRKTGTC